MQPAENLRIVCEVIAVLDRLEIPYALGGSMASSVLGIPRFTQDADITVEPFLGKELAFTTSFSSEYYLSLRSVEEANRRRTSFNILNLAVGFKVDIFVRKDRAFEQSVMKRRLRLALPESPDQPLMIVSPEDILLLKLEWYKLGDEVSDRQWSDILGVLKVQHDRLDTAYLDHWAANLAVTDLLQRAWSEAEKFG
jgi:hypothetical protein